MSDFRRGDATTPFETGPSSGVRLGHVARAVREAVGAYAAPHVADDLVHEALTDAGRPVVPEDGVELRLFVDSYLGPMLESALGTDAAQAIADRLAPVYALLSAIDRERQSDSERAARRSTVPPRSGETRKVFAVVGGHKRLAAELRLFLAMVGDVVRYERIEDLLAASAEVDAVILDARSGVVQLPADDDEVAAVLRPGCPIVVWGEQSCVGPLSRLVPGARVALCAPAAELRELAALTRALAGVI